MASPLKIRQCLGASPASSHGRAAIEDADDLRVVAPTWISSPMLIARARAHTLRARATWGRLDDTFTAELDALLARTSTVLDSRPALAPPPAAPDLVALADRDRL